MDNVKKWTDKPIRFKSLFKLIRSALYTLKCFYEFGGGRIPEGENLELSEVME